MFERYTESARRVLFFARYEATQVGGTAFETEHLLLGLVREGKTLKGFKQFYLALEPIRAEIERRIPVRERISTSVEMPFTEETRRVLRFAGEEADRLLHNYIGPQHLLLGLLREERSVAASILTAQGLTIEDVRAQLSKLPAAEDMCGKTNAKVRSVWPQFSGTWMPPNGSSRSLRGPNPIALKRVSWSPRFSST